MISTDQVREAHEANLYELAIQYGARLRRATVTEYCGACVRCGGRDKFAVNVKKNIWNCRGCGVGGDPIAFVQHVDGVSFANAVGRITGTGGAWTPTPPKRPHPIAAPAMAATDYLEAAARIWNSAVPIANTAGFTYLANRGIDLTYVPNHGGLRFHPRCPWLGATTPCILGRYTDVLAGAPRGVWRRPIDGGKPKSLGPTGGCVIRLWPDEQVEHVLCLGEGVETTLAAATRILFRGARLAPAWAAGSASNMSNFPVLDGIAALTLLVDNDERGAGERASEICDIRWLTAGRETLRIMPEGVNTDFNDLVKP